MTSYSCSTRKQARCCCLCFGANQTVSVRANKAFERRAQGWIHVFLGIAYCRERREPTGPHQHPTDHLFSSSLLLKNSSLPTTEACRRGWLMKKTTEEGGVMTLGERLSTWALTSVWDLSEAWACWQIR